MAGRHSEPAKLICESRDVPNVLTAAEERVLRLVSYAHTNREIASTLGISPATVKRHLENILRKLRLRNRVEAAIYALSMLECGGTMATIVRSPPGAGAARPATIGETALRRPHGGLLRIAITALSGKPLSNTAAR